MRRWFITIFTIATVAVLGLLVWHVLSGEATGTDPGDTNNATTSFPAAEADLPAVEYATRTVSVGGTQVLLRVAEPFDISVAAEGLGKARFMTESPDGRIFVPDMVDYELSHEGKIYILDDFNEATGQFETKQTYLSGLRGPHDVAFYTDNQGQQWIYITLTEHLLRYPYSEGDTAPSAEPEVVYAFPNEQHPEANDVVWHLTRTILFEDDTLYVSIGSGCNVCEESYQQDGRPAILTMTPEGGDVELYAEGIKNAVGMEMVDGTLYATENGVDHLGDDAPNDLLFRVSEGEHYGWPYCYELDREKHRDDSVDWEDPIDCGNIPLSLSAFEPHSAPLGIEYFADAHPVLEGAFLVALQGSWDSSIGAGYKVMRVSKSGESQAFIDGFQSDDGERYGRPVGLLEYSENAFFFTDDHNGRVYYVHAE